MCSIVVLHEVHEKYPLIIAANRDEKYDRPASIPQCVQAVPNVAWAPIDDVSKGTWIGVAAGGWFAGLTNQDEEAPSDTALSRGPVVMDCVRLSNHRLVTKRLIEVDAPKHNHFNMVYGRHGSLFLCKVHGEKQMTVDIIGPGITVITNDTVSSFYSRKESRATVLASFVNENDDERTIIEKLGKMLADHDFHPEPCMSMCVHDDKNGFGTRSSSIILMSKDDDVQYYHRDGHACESERSEANFEKRTFGKHFKVMCNLVNIV